MRRPWLPTAKPRWYDLLMLLPTWWLTRLVLLFHRQRYHPWQQIRDLRDWTQGSTIGNLCYSLVFWVSGLCQLVVLSRLLGLI